MKKNNNSKRNILLILLLFAVSISAISYSLAYLYRDIEPTLINLFTKPIVDIEIEEDFDDEIKKDVVVKNEGNIDIYVRVALKPAWVIVDGDDVEYSGYAVDDIVFTTPAAWIKIGQYYYYRDALAPGDTTSALVGSVGLEAPTNRPDAHVKYRVDVISSSMQAVPEHAVSDAWNIEIVDGRIVGER